MTNPNTAIQHIQQAVATTPEDEPDQADRLESLGLGYRERFLRKGLEEDLDIAIQHLQQAVDITPEDHSDRAGRLQSLGLVYRDRFPRKGLEEDLDTAIRHFQEAVNTTPEDHSVRAGRLHHLGLGYRDRFRRKRSEDDLRIAIQLFEEALSHPSSPILERLRPGRSLLTLRIEAERCSSAYQAASTAVSLIALLAPRSLGTSDKQHLLTKLVV